ncbi:MAG: hypothetical protein HFG70_07665 [Hungatella sp.]|nr:hypothetical protein [Hungatella sp.]
MRLNKEILVQLCAVQAEIQDLQRRIHSLEMFLKDPPVVGDVVKGTRRDGTIGPIKITGIPEPRYVQKEKLCKRYKYIMERKEEELLELTCQAEEYIQSIEQSELRTMLRLRYIDGLTWIQVACQMNCIFPKRRIKYTEDNCWKKNQRFFENVGSCRVKM